MTPLGTNVPALGCSRLRQPSCASMSDRSLAPVLKAGFASCVGSSIHPQVEHVRTLCDEMDEVWYPQQGQVVRLSALVMEHVVGEQAKTFPPRDDVQWSGLFYADGVVGDSTHSTVGAPRRNRVEGHGLLR